MLNPNVFYYIDKAPIQYEGNKRTAEFGYNNGMCCGGHWILGSDFAFEIDFFANTYQHSTVREINSGFKGWYELQEHLLQVESVIHTIKSHDEVLKVLGLKGE